MARYFLHNPADGSPTVFWRGLARFGGVPIQINLNLLAHAVGDDPKSLVPNGGTLVPAQQYAFGRAAGEAVDVQPFAFTTTRAGRTSAPQGTPIGENLRRFLNDPLGGERMDLSLPFYDENMKLGTNGGGWFRPNNNESAFHAATDFNTSPASNFDVCAAADGRVLGVDSQRVVLLHTTPGGREFLTVYVHLDMATFTKRVGDTYRRGEFLARTDPTEANLHLHFGVAVKGPAVTLGAIAVPELWYFIDPWGVYDVRENNYLPRTGKIFESNIRNATHTVQWAAQPLYKAIPIARETAGYKKIRQVQARVRAKDDKRGTMPAEREQFLVWIEGDSDFFLVPLRANDQTMEIELVGLLREGFLHGKSAKLEYRYDRDLRFITAAWVR